MTTDPAAKLADLQIRIAAIRAKKERTS